MDIVNQNSIYSYADYRCFLRDVLSTKKENNPKISLATVGKKLGISKMAVKYIIDGKRHIAERNIPKFTALVPLNETESKYFRYLVCFNKAKTEEERKHFFHRMMAMKDSPFREIVLADKDTGFFVNWFHGTILELMWFKDFKLDAKWIAKRLKFKVTEEEIAEGIKTLRKLGYIGKDASGKDKIVAPNGIKSHIYNNFLKTMIDKSKEALDTHDLEELQFFYLNISVNERKFEMAKEMIKEFRMKLHDALASEDECNRVIQINMQLFNLAKEP
ncbi:MAG: TIGR02147 family protein [Oligoflexales bacterium]